MKKRKNIAFISIGGAGNSILHEIIKRDSIIENPNEQAMYVNFSSSDVGDNFVGNKLILDGDGTGRSQQRGLELVKEKKDLLQKNFALFYQKIKKFSGDDDFIIVIISSLGGGTGSSITPFAIDFMNEVIERDGGRAQLSFAGVLSSPKEGVATLPNCIKSFKNIYNAYVLTDKLKSCFLFDNRKLEKEFQFSTYDFQAMNSIIVDYLEEIYDEESYRVPAAGFQTLDVNEVRRVMFWGKGIADYSHHEFSFIKKKDEDDHEVKAHSNIFGGSFKQNTAKAIACFIKVKKKDFDITPEESSEMNRTLQMFKKKYSSAFFVFGYSFGNKNLKPDYEFRVVVNGFDFPHSFEADVNKASKDVAKLKKENHKFEIKQDADLDF